MTEPVCPYCRMPFAETGPARVFCTACGTPHHEDCYGENGGCTVFGCSRAPADDPKLQVSHTDLSAVHLQPAAQAYAQPYAPTAQPANAPQVQYPPSIYSGPLGLSQAAAPAPARVTAQPAPPAPAPPPGTYFYTPTASPNYPYMPPAAASPQAPKSRTAFIVLGIFLGGLGVHNFYAGYTGKAVGQLCLTILTLGYLAIISWLWAIIEVCIIEKDSRGTPFN